MFLCQTQILGQQLTGAGRDQLVTALFQCRTRPLQGINVAGFNQAVPLVLVVVPASSAPTPAAAASNPAASPTPSSTAGSSA